METVANYKFASIDRIGNGGFGHVEKIELYNLRDESIGFYAKKVLDPKVELKLYRERFEREVISQDRCSHKNIVPIYLANLKIENPYFIMELGDKDLQSIIDSETLSENEKFCIMESILMGIEHIHKCGYIHRDLKPNNVIRFGNGTYKISDFGLIRRADATEEQNPLTSFGIVLGTEDFMAPELRYIGNDYTIKSDIFSIGKIFERLQIQDPALQAIMTKCAKMDPTDRYNTVSEIINDLHIYKEGLAA